MPYNDLIFTFHFSSPPTEYADYEDGDDSTLFPPAIIYDPYEVAVNGNNNNDNNQDEQSMEGRDRFDE